MRLLRIGGTAETHSARAGEQIGKPALDLADAPADRRPPRPQTA
jgi:hypothetical protein